MFNLVLDIYHGNRGIDLAEWKARHALWAVIPKCGGSEDKRLNRFEETTFRTHVAQARQLGLHVGAYYYSDALTVEDALLDAKHCVEKCLAGIKLDMPVYLDIEEPEQLSLPIPVLTAIVTTFCNYIRQAGYMPGIYSGYDGFHNMHEDEIKDYALWVASWRASWPLWAKDYGMWQQGSMRLSDGDIQYDDVSGYVDCNWCQVDYPSIIDKGEHMPESKWALALADCKDPSDYAYCTCAVYSCGYSQPNRKNISIERLEAGTAETDCSYGLGWWLFKGGYLEENPGFHTAIEREYLSQHGFELIDANAGFVRMQRNDVLWKPGHTALYIGEGMQAEALRTERHDAGYDGSTPGDQDNGETVVRRLTYDWDYIIRKIDKPSKDDKKEEETMVPKMGFYSFDSDPTEHFFDGQHLHAIANPDEKRAIIDFYATTGVKLDPNPIPFGTDNAPWGARLNDVLSRGAEFRGFERFVKHPSLKKVLSGVVTDGVKTLTENIKAMLGK